MTRYGHSRCRSLARGVRFCALSYMTRPLQLNW